MLALAAKARQSRVTPQDSDLWSDNTQNSISIGCTRCPDFELCGGLSLATRLYDCLEYCCNSPASCDIVCRNNPAVFVQRVREIDGFDLMNVPRSPRIPVPTMPSVVPLLYHGHSRRLPFHAPAVSVPLYSALPNLHPCKRPARNLDVSERFRYAPDVPLLLTGAAKDHKLEAWWRLGRRRSEVVRELRSLNVKLVTTPNYSLFSNRPRWDDLHSIGRIATTHHEFLREGLAAALHLNARTERDWDRWAEYVHARPEVTHVAFEFTTGAGRVARVPWHVDRLVRFASEVGRPLHLVVRAASPRVLHRLIAAFPNVIALDTNTFMKTIRRRRAWCTQDGRIQWRKSPTPPGQQLDELLAHNWSIVSRYFGHLLRSSETGTCD